MASIFVEHFLKCWHVHSLMISFISHQYKIVCIFRQLREVIRLQLDVINQAQQQQALAEAIKVSKPVKPAS